jgi:hypothetical protein
MTTAKKTKQVQRRCPSCGSARHAVCPLQNPTQVARLSEGDAAKILAELGSGWVCPPFKIEIRGKVKVGTVRRDWGGRWYIVIAVASYYYLSEEDAESMGRPGCDGGWTPCEIREISKPCEYWKL